MDLIRCNIRAVLTRLCAVVASADEVRIRTSVDLSPSSLVQALLSWTPRHSHTTPRGAFPPPIPIVFHPDYGFSDWSRTHRFVMAKFHGVVKQLEALQERRPALRERYRKITDFQPIARDILERVHTPEYVQAFCSGTLEAQAQRRIGLPWSESLVRRTLLECEGTRLTALLALEHGLACNTGGGTHHAFAAHGSGFTIFNDLAVTAQWLLDAKPHSVKRVLILDLDVHQGDGTAAIFKDDPRVHTVSFHCGSNFPFEKQASDVDVALPDGMGDREYLQELCRLPALLSSVEPDLVLYDAGVDVHEDDELGRLTLTDQGLFDRDYYVLRVCAAFKIPIATVVGGGYDSNHELLAWRHSIVFQAAAAANSSC